ncbi:hypothetical protein E2C01_044438 [Portunus trituberculatus]|uniref:Uncharacterized protein n=1 Tax=Portunus trituberculatus TaxID=210409 RepID=A0A5B7FZC2_PORTR|nr:hypothetical protein [Portunus trituberculatus]
MSSKDQKSLPATRDAEAAHPHFVEQLNGCRPLFVGQHRTVCCAELLVSYRNYGLPSRPVAPLNHLLHKAEDVLAR